MLERFHAHRAAFEDLREGLCAAAERWHARYPADPRGPAYLIPAAHQVGPWMSATETTRYDALVHEIGARWAVVEDIEPSCVLNIGAWSAPAGGGYVTTKAWLFGDHWRRKPLAVTSAGYRPQDEGRPKGVDAIVFRGKISGDWSVVYYRTRGADY